MPTWVFHGDSDSVVPFEQSREMVEILKGMGNPDVRFTVYPDGGHGIWNETYAKASLYDWLLSHRRSDRRE
jgi:dipeptidyl aminopeptidase/acylaminoacyl peptidase